MSADVLDTPIRLGALTLRNRIVFAAHLTLYADDGRPTPRHAAYYGARAAGGAGLVIAEEHATDPADRPYENVIEGWNPAALPGMVAITEAVHAHGVPVFAQLTHNGGQSSGMYTRQAVRGPSAVPDPMFREVPVELTVREIGEIVAGYAAAAARCAEAGYDGVEIQAAHSSLVRQFLSPLTNLRTDAYGGTVRGRARLLLEVLEAVRETVGPGRVVGARICGDEGSPSGIALGEAVEVATLVEDRVDYLNTAIGVATSTLHLVVPSMHVPRGYAQHISRALKDAVGVPVLGIGRFTTRAQAEEALRAGHCDLVGAVRAQIADPRFGHEGPHRTCLACNQECVGRTGANRGLGCVVNPRAGREGEPRPAPHPARDVLVVGAGPAGLSAAAEAAGLGHRVLLCERTAEPGGQLLLAAACPGRGELGALVTDLLRECRERDVVIRTNTPVDAELVAALAPAAVLLATGAVPSRPAWAGVSRHVVDVRDVLSGAAVPHGRVIVVDDLGFHPATSTAELLAARGCAVEIVTSAMVVGQDLGLTLDMENFHRRAAALGIRQSTDRVVVAADPPSVVLLHHPTGVVERREAEWVVAAVPPTPVDDLWRALRDGPVPVHRAGDCLAPRRTHAAVLEGWRAAHAV